MEQQVPKGNKENKEKLDRLVLRVILARLELEPLHLFHLKALSS